MVVSHRSSGDHSWWCKSISQKEMENYGYPSSYPDSGDSSPRSREIDFENTAPSPVPWEDQPPNYKAKFMCSYGGKIQPRTHDNQLSYVGGETKILAVDLNIKFSAMISKLSALCNDADVSFKYQLPGEDLDALISVSNDDDLDHMMHEYDRLYRASARPARMRLFLFTNETLNSAPASSQPDPVKPPANNNVDFLFGLDKANAAPPPQPPPATVKFHDPVPELPRAALSPADRVVSSDPNMNHPLEIQRQLQRLQVVENEQAAYRRKSEDNVVGNYHAGDYYVHKLPEKLPPSNFPANAPPPPQAGYWPEKHVSGEVYSPTVSAAPGGGDQPVYVIPAPGSFYHAPVMRPPAAPATQGYYTVQRMHSDAYREPPVYGGAPPPKVPFSSAVPAQPVKAPTYTEGFSVVRPAGIPDNTAAAYAHVAYDSASGRQVYYTAPGGMMHAPPYQGVAPPVNADMRQGGVSLGQEVKMINKVSQGSV
ncbi:leucine-rich repeat extensin-like protein 3 [Gastrolobium bilobum]|uniref:leucine-rich repeat extensin-like protein 3 n=1 Tax=Gastrolobium bilobum TaxID=150636 RepID=UPI002AAF7ACA|nr:leucine-rich repeat extensin-like protein 3 [Gastrolobium bilobum]